MSHPRLRPILLGLVLLISPTLRAEDADTYRRPSPALAALVDAPLPPAALLSTGRKTLLLMERREAPSIAELSQPELRLAGWRINPATNGPSRALTYSALRLKPVGEGPEVRVTGLPDGAAIADCQWSRDARHIAVTVNRANGIELWLVDATTAQARRLTGPILNGATGTEPCVWLNDSTLVIRRIPEGRGAAPIAPTVPAGPVVQENRGTRTASRTYEDMLQNAHDEALFEHYVKSELATVSIDGAIERIAPAALHTRVAPSPDGRYLLVDKLHRPYSHLVPATRFPTQIVVLERGRQVYQVADLPLSENTTSGVRAGPRGVQWRADAPATLSWTTALPARGEAKDQKRDAWLMLAAPFTGKPVEQHRFEYYVQSVTWGDDSLALVTESWQRTRTQRTWRVAPGDAKQAPQLLSERSSLDRYSDPGRPALTRNAYGRMVLQRSADGSKLYFYGAGASPEGDRPMLDEFDLATRKSRRLWRSAPPHYEEFVAFLDAGLTTLLTRRESIEEPGGYCIRSLADGRVTPITNSPNPYAGLAGVKGELIRYQRADGTALSGTLYLPPGYKPEQGPLPTLIWAYPREHLSADTAEQVNAAPEKFTRISVNGPLPFLLAGYAVLNDPTMPIIGRNGAQPNDTYIEQLVASAKAAVDELVRRGVTDPKRVAIAGHSYGAFMTANLLAHSTLFRAGIARSGAYNRTLTPFGFQSETRNFWQAPAVYAAMSPFNHADKIKAPLLLIHGEADDNAGTFPVQSERFYAALKGHGATTRFVLLPHEAHGYRARESLLHMLWEMETWLDRHVKASAPMAPKP
jgi:dipeptidyl aminopeptidase/acylaminoacyl peptidase